MKQTHTHFKIYFVDSNSTDGTANWLRGQSNARVTLVPATDNDYWTGATNRGVARALHDGCDYVLTINDDAIPSFNLLDVLLRCALDQGWLVLGSRVNFLDRPSLVWSVGSYNTWGTSEIYQLFDNEIEERSALPKYAGKRAVKVEAMCGNGVLIHRSVFEKIGLYDDIRCPHYHADSEFIMRASKNGIHCGVCIDAVNYNDVSAYARQEPVWEIKDRWFMEGKPIVGIAVDWFKKVSRLFLQRRSERRILTTLYIVRQYCPRGYRLSTFVRYILRAVGLFLLPCGIQKVDAAKIKIGAEKFLSLRISVAVQWMHSWLRIRIRKAAAKFAARHAVGPFD